VTYGDGRLLCDASKPPTIQINWPGNGPQQPKNGPTLAFHGLAWIGQPRCCHDPAFDAHPPTDCFNTIEGHISGRLRSTQGNGNKKTTTDWDARLEFRLIDNGEPGRAEDRVRFVITDSQGVVLFVDGPTRGGNQQAHVYGYAKKTCACPTC
jgi:hypothetical protein